MLVLSAVDYDFRKEKLGKVLDLIDHVKAIKQKEADPRIILDVITLTATCAVCDEKAQYTMRKSSQKEPIVVGGADIYMPVCSQHHYVIREQEEEEEFGIQNRSVCP